MLRGAAVEPRATPLYARRFLEDANPPLSELLTLTLGGGWRDDPLSFARLEKLAFESPFRGAFRKARRAVMAIRVKFLAQRSRQRAVHFGPQTEDLG